MLYQKLCLFKPIYLFCIWAISLLSPNVNAEILPQNNVQKQQVISKTKKQNSKKVLKNILKKWIKKSAIPPQKLGIIIADSQQVLYQLNANKSFIPASLIKIFTASVLLDLLSPSLTFYTQFLSTKKIKNSVLKGNLYLKGGGDPGFVSESLWNLVNNLKRNKIKKIEGDLILDSSRFDKHSRGSRLHRPSHSSYDAPVGALSFNWNTSNFYFRPGKKIGNHLQVNIDPSSLYFVSIKNKTKTVTKNKMHTILIKRKNEKTLRESVILKGSLSLHSPEILIYKNILFPATWTGWNAIEFLKQRKIHITGTVKKGITPSHASVLANWKSRPLLEYIKLMMKFSNNFIIEMLVKNMVVELKNTKGNLKAGLKIIKNHIQKIGIPKTEYQLIQASGLSRKNKITPKHLLTILKYWLHHPLQPEFESTLPLSGEYGTLKKYFKKAALKGRIHAKTGTLNGVTGLAGYLITKTGKKIMFVFLFNGSMKLTKKANKLFKKSASIIWKF